MTTVSSELVTVEAQLQTRLAEVQLLWVDLDEPIDRTVNDGDVYRIDMSLTPRPKDVRLCYPERWAPTRFERIGSLLAIPPGQSTHVRSSQGQHRSVVCRLTADCQRELMQGHDWSERALAATLDITDRGLFAVLSQLASEVQTPGFASTLLVESLAAQLAILLTRYHGRIEQDRRRSGLAAWRLRLIDERLHEIREAPSLDELATLCRISLRQLSRGFRQSRGCSLGEYVASVRLNHAKQLLLRDYSVKQVAHALGFGSASAFCFAFRRDTCLTPLQFRNAQANSEHCT